MNVKRLVDNLLCEEVDLTIYSTDGSLAMNIELTPRIRKFGIVNKQFMDSGSKELGFYTFKDAAAVENAVKAIVDYAKNTGRKVKREEKDSGKVSLVISR